MRIRADILGSISFSAPMALPPRRGLLFAYPHCRMPQKPDGDRSENNTTIEGGGEILESSNTWQLANRLLNRSGREVLGVWRIVQQILAAPGLAL